MNTSTSIAGFGRYEALRKDLESLCVDFRSAMEEYPLIWHQRISPLYGPLSHEQWDAFLATTRCRTCQHWEQWELFPSMACCSRFYSGEISLGTFKRMASKGTELLSELKRLSEEKGAILPVGLKLCMPDDGHHYGWLELLYQTALCYSSPYLYAEPGFWSRTGSMTPAEEDEPWTKSATGVEYPIHPFFTDLRRDLFCSSFEAIRLWLNPVSKIRMGDKITETPIYLPTPPERNGPAWPDRLWLWGKCYDGFSPEAWQLLDCLFGREPIPFAAAIRHVFGEGEDEDARRGSIISLKKRLAKELINKKCPAEVHQNGEYIYLEVFKPN